MSLHYGNHTPEEIEQWARGVREKVAAKRVAAGLVVSHTVDSVKYDPVRDRVVSNETICPHAAGRIKLRFSV